MAGSIALQGTVTGSTIGSQLIGPFVFPQNSGGQFETFPYSFTGFTGHSEFSIPTWANNTILTFTPTPSGTVGVGGSTSDVAGAPVSLTVPTVLSWLGTNATNFWIIFAAFTGTGWITHF